MRKKIDAKKIILNTVALAGTVAVGLVAPNALRALSQLGILPNKRQKEIFESTRKRLIRQGLLEYKNDVVHLTPRGEKILRHIELKNYQIRKPRKWNGKWHVLIFDIPEKRKRTREQIRATLAQIGFVHLQDSVWAYPYDCEELVTLLKADMHIGNSILYMIVERLEGDRYLKECFGL